ncbi:ribosome recycling factor, partial [Pyxidicoccus sp. 3LG]
MSGDVVAELKGRIDKTLEDLRRELQKVRTGRASTAILDGVRVDYYGTPTPLSGVASVNAPEPRLITIKPWEKSVLKDIEKALREANLGINPMNDGEMIRLPFPPLTEERRKDIAKQVKTKGEDHKVAIRNVRRDANSAGHVRVFSSAGLLLAEFACRSRLEHALAHTRPCGDGGVEVTHGHHHLRR